MHHLIILSILFMVFSSCKNVNKEFVPATDSLIEYTGRIDFSKPGVPAFSYSGVSFRACFKGTGISVKMFDEKGMNYYNILLDSKVIQRLHPSKGTSTYTLASGLNDTIHEIEIFRLTEEMFGKTGFYGFFIQGNIVQLVNKRERFIEYIGNSITCGYGNEGTLDSVFGPGTENHFMTYAAITSRNFNARHMAVCKSGIGIYRNYDGPVEGNVDCMPNYYSRIFLYEDNPKYSFPVTPDLICINLGTNDFSTIGGDSARFVDGYLRFIDTLQTRYKDPEITCLMGPMVKDDVATEFRKYLSYIAETADKKGRGKVHFFEMSAQTGDLGIGTDYHPTIAQHEKNAAELTDYISKLKGWKKIGSN